MVIADRSPDAASRTTDRTNSAVSLTKYEASLAPDTAPASAETAKRA